MRLILKRSQRQGGMFGGKLFFMLDDRADLTKEEASLIAKYGLGSEPLYDSHERQQQVAIASNHFRQAHDEGSLLKIAAGLGRAALASLTLRVTIGSLQQGQHFECKDLSELLATEQAIRESCERLKVYLQAAETFDGREEVVEF